MAGEIVLELELEKAYETAVEPTQRVCEVASMFGLGVDPRKRVQVVPPVRVPVRAGSVIFITGASGGGKSTLLRLIGEALRAREDVRVVDFGEMGDGTRRGEGDEASGEGSAPQSEAPSPQPSPQWRGDAIVEQMGGTLEEAVRWLALAGLNDAFVMLRKPEELSDGQRYRFKLARAMAESERMWVAPVAPGDPQGRGDSQGRDVGCGSPQATRKGEMSDVKTTGRVDLTVVLADEFAATLDRLTAAVIGRNVRKWVDRTCASNTSDIRHRTSDICFIAVSTHDDLLEHLEPDVLVVQEPGEGIVVRCRERNDE